MRAQTVLGFQKRQRISDLVLQKIKLEASPAQVASNDEEESAYSSATAAVVEKTLDQLLDELKAKNLNNESIIALIESGTLENQIKAIESAGKNGINAWDKEAVLKWAHHRRFERGEESSSAAAAASASSIAKGDIIEMIAVIARANVLASGHEPRIAQLLSLLVLLEAKEQGRLSQIATGEGKTTIVAMLAAIKVLQGEKPDVISSSPVLAVDGVEDKKAFYEMLGISVAHNWHENDDADRSLSYLADVVYGDASTFQADFLRQEYLQEKTRGTRPYGMAIVDEVDNMFVDKGPDYVSLGSNKPLMEHLEPLYIAIWAELKRSSPSNNASLPQDVIPGQAEGLNQGSISALSSGSRVQTFSLPRDDNDVRTRVDDLTRFIHRVLDLTTPLIRIPQHLKAFAKAQAPYWARSAFNASENFKEDKDYVVVTHAGQKIIAPVDYLNTGVIHPNSAWDDGFHQFLQIKHNVPLTPENLTASFSSNMGYFQKYGKNIYGLTGTLGSPDVQALLKDLYALDLCFMPTYRPKRFEEIPGILAESPEAWVANIVASVKKEVANKRAALIICESIAMVTSLKKALEDAGIDNIQRYDRNDISDAAVKNAAKPGDVIIATNIAGRGTDIKTTPEVEGNGGLYVCVTFLPHSKRVEDQAFGRTSRQGNLGTAQLITEKNAAILQLSAEYDAIGNANTFAEIKECRDVVEGARLLVAKHIESKKTLLKDHLFEKFCELAKRLRGIDSRSYRMQEVEEQWGLWFKNIDRKIAAKEGLQDEAIHAEFEKEILGEFEAFKEKTLQEFNTHTLQNAMQWIKAGEARTTTRDAIPDAINAFTTAISMDPVFCAQAYCHRALVTIWGQCDNYKQNAIFDLQKARANIVDESMPQLSICFTTALNF